MSAPASEDPMPFSVMTAIEDLPKTAPPGRGNPLLRYLKVSPPAELRQTPANDNQPPAAEPTPTTE